MKLNKILLIDDHAILLDGLSQLINNTAGLELTATAASGEEAFQILSDHTVDLVITDLSLPDMDGVTINKTIKQQYKTTKTLVFSSYNHAPHIEQLLKDQVDGYILKSENQDTIREAILSVLSGAKHFSQEVKELWTATMFDLPTSSASSPPSKGYKLSPREKEILQLIAAENTTSEIATKLFISEHTVNSHRKRLLAKLNVKNTIGLLKKAIELNQE